MSSRSQAACVCHEVQVTRRFLNAGRDRQQGGEGQVHTPRFSTFRFNESLVSVSRGRSRAALGRAFRTQNTRLSLQDVAEYMLRFLTLMLCLVAHVAGFNLAARREVIQTAIGVATLATPLAPAVARSKASVQPNKVEGTGANAGSYIRDQYKAEYAAMAGDKGSRGVASKEFEKNDTVQKNRDLNGGVARDANGRKIARADRNRPPEELGLKQWDGGGGIYGRSY